MTTPARRDSRVTPPRHLWVPAARTHSRTVHSAIGGGTRPLPTRVGNSVPTAFNTGKAALSPDRGEVSDHFSTGFPQEYSVLFPICFRQGNLVKYSHREGAGWKRAMEACDR